MRFAAAVGIVVAIGACHSDSGNTAPLVATSITADVSTNGQTAPVGTALAQPVSVHVTDQNGNAIANATVTWTVVNHAGSTAAATSVTDATGAASVAWTIDTIARIDSLTASIASGTSVVLTATGQAGAATNAAMVSGDAQSVASGSASAPFVIKVTDHYGNPCSGVSVAWIVTGGGTLSAPTSATDATGATSVTLTLGATPGPYVITATAGTLTAVTFNLTGT